MRVIYFCVGLLCTGLGIVGLMLPVMPGTVFLIAAVACFAKSSPRMERWLLEHRLFGATLRAWRESGSISLKIKVLAIVLIWLSIAASVLWMPALPALKAVLVAVAISVTVFLATRPTRSASLKSRAD
ncbi:MAG: YbaN family protein [Armatimonadetes bacterium]|nr:YbaN family protein [Armatimonadota bacterium]